MHNGSIHTMPFCKFDSGYKGRRAIDFLVSLNYSPLNRHTSHYEHLGYTVSHRWHTSRTHRLMFEATTYLVSRPVSPRTTIRVRTSLVSSQPPTRRMSNSNCGLCYTTYIIVIFRVVFPNGYDNVVEYAFPPWFNEPWYNNE